MPYDPRWPKLFRREAAHLHSCIPAGLIRRIEHFGSTAVPGLAAKPVIDLLVEVRGLRAARTQVAGFLEAGRQGKMILFRGRLIETRAALAFAVGFQGVHPSVNLPLL